MTVGWVGVTALRVRTRTRLRPAGGRGAGYGRAAWEPRWGERQWRGGPGSCGKWGGASLGLLADRGSGSRLSWIAENRLLQEESPRVVGPAVARAKLREIVLLRGSLQPYL